MMKIFINARFLTQPISGVQRYGIECSRQIKKLYHNVVFLAPPGILHAEIAAEFGVKVIGKNKGHLWEQSDLPAFMTNNGHAPLLSLANTAPFFYKNNYITIHDLAFYHHPEWNSKAFSAWYNWLLPRIAKRAKQIFTVSNTMRDEIIKYYKVPADKISVTYNGLSQAILQRDRSSCLKKEKIILSVGSFNARKNHHNLVKAFIESDIREHYRLIIVGDKNKVFRESNLDENIISNNNIQILQQLNEDELLDIYCRAEVIVSLSVYEGFGIPILEGLYFGCKVLCSDIPVYRELYDKYAYFCDPYDINRIKESLKKIAADNNETSTTESSLWLDRYNYQSAAHTIIEQIVSVTSHTAK